MADYITMPRLGLNDSSNLMGEWFVKEGDKVQEGDELFSIETDKSTMSVYAETSGVVLKIFYDEAEVVDVLAPVCIIGEEGEDIDEMIMSAQKNESSDSECFAESVDPILGKETVMSEENKKADSSCVESAEKFFSPRAKIIANQNGIDLVDIPASGAENRILENDVINYMRTSGAGNMVAQNNVTRAGETVRLSKIRSVIAENMMNSLATTAQLTSTMVFNASSLLDCRAGFKMSSDKLSKVTIGEMILFAVSRTLVDFKYMNSHMVEDGITTFDDVNLGYAVDTERGLMVPTIVAANKLSIVELSQTAKRLVEECRAGNIIPDKLKGATFTVSNLGTFGVLNFTPILNPPQVGILGVGAIDYSLKKTSQGILYFPSGHLSLTYDHRAVDGAPSARFLQALCDKLEHFGDLI